MRLTLAAMTLASSMILVDQTAVPLAAPHAIEGLHASIDESQWLMTANILPLAALAQAREAFLTGTTRDVQPIRSVDGILLPAAPGPVTRKAADIFAERSAEDLDP